MIRCTTPPPSQYLYNFTAIHVAHEDCSSHPRSHCYYCDLFDAWKTENSEASTLSPTQDTTTCLNSDGVLRSVLPQSDLLLTTIPRRRYLGIVRVPPSSRNHQGTSLMYRTTKNRRGSTAPTPPPAPTEPDLGNKKRPNKSETMTVGPHKVSKIRG